MAILLLVYRNYHIFVNKIETISHDNNNYTNRSPVETKMVGRHKVIRT